MALDLHISDEALAVLRPLFIEAEGDCEAWTDEQVVTGMLIRGRMDYGRSLGKPFAETTAAARTARKGLSVS